jgi:GTP-binding protein
MNPVYRKARFLLGAPDLRRLPPDTGREVAFAGRSNAGKSSAINAITGQKALARTSKTPGRTQQINVFPVCDDRYLIDLPGYGFAKLPQAIRLHWQRTLPQYLQRRRSLWGLMLIMDVRHPLTVLDQQMLAWCSAASIPVHVLLTKADKLNQGPAAKALRSAADRLARDHPGTSVQLFSALRHRGLEAVHGKLDAWLALGPDPRVGPELTGEDDVSYRTAVPSAHPGRT